MTGLNKILVCLTFGQLAALFRSTDAVFNCDPQDETAAKKFQRELCPLFGTLDCHDAFGQCYNGKGIHLTAAIGKCAQFFPQTNFDDYQNVLCHVCENTANAGQEPDGLQILCCFKKYELDGTNFNNTERDEITATCRNKLDPNTCKATAQRTKLCASF